MLFRSLILAAVGSALTFAAVSAVAVNTLPNHLAGMASGATSTFRDVGFALGPAIIGAIALGRAARAAFEFVPLADGSEIALGPAVKLRALETPGHTPEGITLLVFDGGDEPRAALTGDTLFIGDVGRPDLMASEGSTADALAGQLYDSIHGKLLKLPDSVLVHPAHGAGSMCGKALSSERVSTIGEQRRTNPALQPMSRSPSSESHTIPNSR